MEAIDYVVPMVFNDDPLWREDFKRVGGRYDESNKFEFVRYRSWGTEELLIRCVRKFMPFVRTIYIILARESQKKEWMEQDGICVVYHRDFMPEWALPTFNSRGMEMFLKDIPGISSRFLYGNDDMFPLAPLTAEDFFVDGKPCIHMTEKVFPCDPNNFQMACMCGLNFVAKEFGLHFTDKWYKNGHSIAPIMKGTCKHLWDRGSREIVASLSPFRTSKNFNQYIYSWWQYFSGEYVDRVPNKTYVSTKKSVDEVLKAVTDSNGIVCINDHEDGGDYMRYARAVKEAIENKLKN